MSRPVIKRDEVGTSQRMQDLINELNDAIQKDANLRRIVGGASATGNTVTPRVGETASLRKDRYDLEANPSVKRTLITVGGSRQKATSLLTSGAIVTTQSVSFADAEFVLRRAGLVAKNISAKTFTIDVSDKNFPSSEMLDGAEKMIVSVIINSEGVVQSAIVGLRMASGEGIVIDTDDRAILSSFTHETSEPIAQQR